MVIYNIYEKKLMEVPVSTGAKHEEEMMKSDFVQLTWNDTAKQVLEAGTYIVPFSDGVKYRLLEDYIPKQTRENKFEYSPQFQHPVMMLGKVPFILVTGDTHTFLTADKETDWVYTGTALTIISRIKDYINTVGATIEDIGTGWIAIVDSDIVGSKTCTFSSVDVLSAITECCNQWECEAHLDYGSKVLYFGKVAIGQSVTLKVGDNVGVPTLNESKEGYYNAYLVKGSTRNISQKSASGENTQVNKRLTLDPVKYPYGYIDRRETTFEPLMIKELIFEDVYPHLDLYVYNCRSRVRYLKDDEGNRVLDVDGNPKKYAVWYIRLAYFLNGVWMDYKITDDQIIDGKTLSISFQANEESGALPSPLAGREFELHYHKAAETIPANAAEGDTGVNVLAGDYEIVFEQADLIIPTTKEGELYPRGETTPSKKGNKALLFNIAMSETYLKQAYLDLEETALKEVERLQSDLNNYAVPSNPVVFEDTLKNPKLHIGRKVTYDDGNGYQLETRVLKLVTRIDRPHIQTITVGNEQIKGTISEMREQIQHIVTGGGGTGGGSGSGVNVYELKNLLMYYGKNYFLSKEGDDGTPYSLDIGQNLHVGGDTNIDGSLNVGGDIKIGGDIDLDGFLKVLAMYVDKMQSTNYTGDGLLDTGWKLTNDKDGHSYLVVDELMVRMKAVFNELEVRKLTYSGGNVIYSGAGSKIFRVEYLHKSSPDDEDGEILGYTTVKVPWLLFGSPLAIGNHVLGSRKKVRTEVDMSKVTHFRCYLIADDGSMATTNWWQKWDQARCQTFNLLKNGRDGANGTDSKNTYSINEDGLQNNFYWRLVSRVGKQKLEDDLTYDYVDLSKDDCLAGSGIPVAGDSIVQFGNRQVTERQNVVTIEVVGEDAPAIKEYMGINSYDLTGKRRTMISPKSGDEFYATKFVQVTTYGALVPVPVDRGRWLDIVPDAKGNRRCYYYDRVSHNGSIWLCMVADGWHYEDADGNIVAEGTEGAIRTRNYTTDEPSETSQYWQISVEKGDRGYATFKSTVFKRAAKKPEKPSPHEGSFASPVPSGWSDGLPAGSETIWMTSRVFTSDGGGIQQMKWTDVELMSDSENFDVEFAKLQPNRAKPADPDYNVNAKKGDTSANKVWYDPSEIDDVNVKSEDMVWMATRIKVDGVWGDWTITKIKGEDGGFKSTVFCRTNSKPDTPSGGTYANPYPGAKEGTGYIEGKMSGWYDGIPTTPEDFQIWMSVCTFYPDDSSSGWSAPQPQSDTDTLDIEFSPSTTEPAAPKGDTPFANHESEGWYDPNSSKFASAGKMIWRGERKVSNGEYDGAWVITRIYGEKGDTGTRGNFKSQCFKRSNDDLSKTTPSGGTYENPIPDGWFDGVPDGEEQIWMTVCTFYGAGGNSGWSKPQPQSDTDTLDIEFSPSTTEPAASTLRSTPGAAHPSTGIWYDPSHLPSGQTMIWRAERKISNGVYDGDWVITRIYGEKGDPGNNASGTALRFSAALSESDTKPTLATYSNFAWYNNAPNPTAAKPYVYCILWKTDYNGNLLVPLSVSLYAKYGDDASSCYLTNPSVIIGQATTSPYSMLIDATPTGNTASSVIARKGSTACTVQLGKLETYHCNASRYYGEQYYSDTFWITDVLTDSDSNYYETGWVKAHFTVTNPDGTSYSEVLQFNFYCNLMGTWKQTVEGDMEKSIANKKYYTYDANGNVVSSMTLAEYIRSSSINSATLEKKVNDNVSAISKIEQTAEQITMEVNEVSEGYYQLLEDTDFLIVPSLDNDGNPVYDSDGNIVTVEKLDAWDAHEGSINTLSSNQHDGYNSFYSYNSASSYKDFLQQRLWNIDGSIERIKKNRWYTLTFWVKGYGTLRTFVYPGCVDTSAGCYIDGVKANIGTDGNVSWSLSSSWEKHTFTFKTIDSDTFYNAARTYYAVQYLLFRLMNIYNYAYIAQPRLEMGMVAHAYKENMLGLNRTGIDIKNGKIVLDAETAEATNDFVVKRLVTKGSGNGVHVEIYDGVMNVFGLNGIANWRFGVDDDNNAILSYYDNSGVKRYDLGPDGITDIQNYQEAFTEIKNYIQVAIVTNSPDEMMKTIVASQSTMKAIFSQKAATVYYCYSAKKTKTSAGYTYYGSDTQSDVKYAASAEAAKEADQKLFYQKTSVASNNRVNAVVRLANIYPPSNEQGVLTSDPTGAYQQYASYYWQTVKWDGSLPIYGVTLIWLDYNGKRQREINVWSNYLY